MTSNPKPVDVSKEFAAAKEQEAEYAKLHVRWMTGEKLDGPTMVEISKWVGEYNAAAKVNKLEPLPKPCIADVVLAYHPYLICNDQRRAKLSWYDCDVRTSTYHDVSDVGVLISRVMEELEHQEKGWDATVRNVTTRLQARCQIIGLVRAPCLIDHDKREAYELNPKANEKAAAKGIAGVMACKTEWYLLFENGKHKKQSYTPSVFLLNRLPCDPAEKPNPEFAEDWAEDRLGKNQAKAFWEWIAYCLTPYNTFKRYHVWFGPSNTGKSTGVDLVRMVLGEENCDHQSIDALTGRFGLADIRGKLLNIAEEDAGYGHKVEKLVKNIVGGTPIGYEVKGKERGSHLPTFKLLFTENDKPQIVDHSKGIANRMVILNWDKVVPKGSHTKEWFVKRFKDELPHILGYCLQVRREITKRGGLYIPPESVELLAEVEYESNPVHVWLKERAFFKPDSKLPKDEAYDDFRTWCLRNSRTPIHDGTFAKRLKALPDYQDGSFSEDRLPPSGGRKRVWVGLALRADEEAKAALLARADQKRTARQGTS